MNFTPLIPFILGLLGAPLLVGIINRTKAGFAGRTGAPLLQLYFDLYKLLNKGVVYSRTTTWVFRATPVIGLASLIGCFLILPAAGTSAPVSFAGDLILLAYLLGLTRFLTVAAALDTGSAFEGMGAAREVQFSALAEPALFICLATLVLITGSISLTGIFTGLSTAVGLQQGPGLLLIIAALLIVFLSENSRIPVDDPNTHLELTMIHEVMILDYSGPDLAFILYGASLKLWLLGTLIVNIVLSVIPVSATFSPLLHIAGMILLAVLVGGIESFMARLSLLRVPKLLIGATALSVMAVALVLRSAI